MAVSRPVRCSTQSMILRMGLRRSDLEFACLYLDHVAIERPGRGTGEHLAINRERGGVAGADERMGGVVPMAGTTQKRAIGRERGYLAVGLFHDPGGRFLANHFPA